MPAASPLEGTLATLGTWFDDAANNLSSRHWNGSSAAATNSSLQNGYFIDALNSSFEDGFFDIANTSTPEYDTVIVQIASPVYIFFTPCLIAFGVSGNLLSVFVFFKSRLYLQSNNQYLIVLQLSDTVFLLQLLPAWLSTMEINGLFNVPVFCKTFEYLTYVSCTLSSWLVLAFTTERCFVVQHPLLRPAVCTVRRARANIAALAAAAAIVNAPVLHFAGSGDDVCSVHPDRMRYAEVFNWVDTTLTFTAPLLIIMVLNVRIALAVCRFQKARRLLMETDDSHLRVQRKITNMLLVVSSVFFILNLPAYVLRIYAYASDFESHEVDDIWMTLHTVATVLFNANFGINFFLYCLSAQNFRRALLQSVPCLRWLVRNFNALTTRTPPNDLRGSGPYTSAVSNRTEATCDVDYIRRKIRKSAVLALNHRTNIQVMMDATSDNKDGKKTELKPTIIDMSDKIEEAGKDDNMETNSEQPSQSAGSSIKEVTCELHDTKQQEQKEALREDDMVESSVATTETVDLGDKMRLRRRGAKYIKRRPKATRANDNTKPIEASSANDNIKTTEASSANDNIKTMEASSASDNIKTTEASSANDNIKTMEASSANDNIKTTEASSANDNIKTMEASSANDNIKPIEASSANDNIKTTEASSANDNFKTMELSSANDNIKPIEASSANDNIKTIETSSASGNIKLIEASSAEDKIVEKEQGSPKSDLCEMMQATCINENNGTNVTQPLVQSSDAIEVTCEVHDSTPKERLTTTSTRAHEIEATRKGANLRKGVRRPAAVDSDKIETISDDNNDSRHETVSVFRCETRYDINNITRTMRQTSLSYPGFPDYPPHVSDDTTTNLYQPSTSYRTRVASDRENMGISSWRRSLMDERIRLGMTQGLGNINSNTRLTQGKVIYRWKFDNSNRGGPRKRPQFTIEDLSQPGPSRGTANAPVAATNWPSVFKRRFKLRQLLPRYSREQRRKAIAHLYD